MKGAGTFIAAALLMLAMASATPAEKIDDPHWTGKPCADCSIDNGTEPGMSADQINARCNTCHYPGSEMGSEPHPVGMPVPKEILPRVPEGWPLASGKISCLTCHDVKLQAWDNTVGRIFNKNFLRPTPPGAVSICFVCHESRRFEQPNPHIHMIVDGKIQESNCLKCHTEVPDRTVARHAVLKQDSDLLCIGCHSKQVRRHPARADHMVKMPADMKQALPEPALHLGEYDMIHCTTCHNPHERSVIQNERCARGAGEPALVRLPARYELCVYCHGELKVNREKLRRPPERHFQKAPAQPMITHKPWAENKCKACHAVRADRREKPQAVFLCFREGCHETKLVEKTFRHDLSVLKNCYFCHESHGAEYPKLLRSNEERICHTCHPLLRDKGSHPPELRNPLQVHQAFFDYQMDLGVETDNTCNFCHSSRHWTKIDKIDTGACTDCHLYTSTILRQATGSPLNRHDTYAEKKCSTCHDPHAAEHKDLLKKPREEYGK